MGERVQADLVFAGDSRERSQLAYETFAKATEGTGITVIRDSFREVGEVALRATFSYPEIGASILSQIVDQFRYVSFYLERSAMGEVVATLYPEAGVAVDTLAKSLEQGHDVDGEKTALKIALQLLRRNGWVLDEMLPKTHAQMLYAEAERVLLIRGFEENHLAAVQRTVYAFCLQK